MRKRTHKHTDTFINRGNVVRNMHGGGVTHLIFPFTAHWVIIREDEVCRLISFHVLSQSMTVEYLYHVPAWGAKTTFVPVVTFTPSQPTVGCLFHFALRFSQLVIAVPTQ